MIDFLLEADGLVTVGEVARFLGCGERTVRRDVELLIRRGVDIERVSGRSGGIRLGRSASGQPRDFDSGIRTPAVGSARQFSTEIIGRESEVSLLRDALETARSGRTATAFLSGPPGIGKTRLATGFYTNAGSYGLDAFWFSGSETEGRPPYWVWSQLLDQLARARGKSFIQKAPAELAAHLAAAVPELEWIADSPRELFTDDPDYSLLAVQSVMASLVRFAADEWPVLIVLDDLQWMDSSSVRMLGYLIDELHDARLAVVSTVRSADPAQTTEIERVLSSARRSSNSTVIQLASLDMESTLQLVDSVAGPEVRAGERVWELSRGNPLFATELSRLAANSIEESDFSRLPDSVNSVVERRLGGLSPGAREVLEIASAIEPGFSLHELERTAGLLDHGGPWIVGALDDAYEARIAARSADHSGYVFAHPLYRRWIHDNLAPSRRASIHAAIAAGRESELGDASDLRAIELVGHFFEARDILGHRTAVHYALLAGDQSLTRFAPIEAQRYFEMGLASTLDGDPDELIGDLEYGIGMSLNYQVKPTEAVERLLRAIELYERAGDSANVVKVASVGIQRSTSGGGGLQQIVLCEKGLSFAGPGSLDRARILNEYGMALNASDSAIVEFEEALRESIDLARVHEEPQLEAHALANLAFAFVWHGMYSDAADAAGEVLRVVDKVRSPTIERFCYRACVYTYGLAGRPRVALEAANALVRAIERAGAELSGPVAFDFHLAISLNVQCGKWAEAKRLNGRRSQLSGDVGESGNGGLIDFLTQDEERGLAAVERHLSQLPLNSEVGALAELAETALTCAEIARRLDGDRPHAAISQVCEFVMSDPGADPSSRWAAGAALALIACTKRDSMAVLLARSQILETSGQLYYLSRIISPDRLLALLEVVGEDQEAATGCFVKAAELCERGGALPELANVIFDHASWLAGDIESPDWEVIDELVSRGESVAVELGMGPLIGRFGELQRRSEQVRPVPADHADMSLSGRELEVLRLVANGQSNREIAKTLFVTVNTVARHISNILIKTGASNRAEAAVIASRDGLLGAD